MWADDKRGMLTDLRYASVAFLTIDSLSLDLHPEPNIFPKKELQLKSVSIDQEKIVTIRFVYKVIALLPTFIQVFEI
jgi:hypothetical protein